MRNWENQYIQLVATKPNVIVAENDRAAPLASKSAVSQLGAKYDGVFVEIGSGSGLHLLELAKQNPSYLCVGLEIRFKRAFKTGEKAERQGLANVLVLRTDARFISAIFEDNSVAGFFVNYPDPWDKRRWLKNRILNQDSLSEMHRLLNERGFLRYKTDHHDYFDSVCALLNKDNWEIVKHSNDLLASSYIQENIPTEFEYLFKSQNKPLYLVEARKL
jgi:tRNA (guanine-N7-)-methyltransferase